MMKRHFIALTLILLVTVFLPSARSLEAAEDCYSGYGPPPPGQEFCCTFTPASGINLPGGSLPCDGKLLANYIVALNIFFYRLAIVLAVLMITIGGFQWLSAMGNVGKIGNAKETIEQAVIGLALAFTAYIIFSQIDERFVNLSSLEIKPGNISITCSDYTTLASCPLSRCEWYCPNGVALSSIGDRNCIKYGDPDGAGLQGTCVDPSKTTNYCTESVYASAKSKLDRRIVCGFTREEKACLEQQRLATPQGQSWTDTLPSSFTCCVNNTEKLFAYSRISCSDCPIPAGYTGSGTFWVEDRNNCLLPADFKNFNVP